MAKLPRMQKMKDGLYKVVFDSNVNPNGQCDGIVSIRDNRINGGDYVCFYRGLIQSGGVTLQVVRHNPNDTTVFNGVDNVELALQVKEIGEGAIFNGSVWSRPDLTISGSLTFLSELI
ncbi:negative regulator GrlR [Salmonella enterica subsp. enterica]|nr:negative regulator GrlR [Salmonella enterica subsp. enterica serovar Muenchen]EAA9906610.1 negative regulator GrlR [Salmonella enterica]EBL4970946.1 negative regulator GrlR [Salmonella enterica subsp. enterica serovar Newport]EBZ5930846.1 negative regulator GrlR [Salmonella enterica subsp. enterica serovar Weslaco]EBZ6049163.1 negative regulator GrlR [Salmonella enterica subsp. enterica serovar Texas]EBZ8368151.1 negative regulator GrlR [Salmonella enterica subsp. enterica serovar Heidelber